MASSYLPSVIARLSASMRSATQLDGEGLAAFRIATGSILVADAILRTRDFWLFFSPTGIFPPGNLLAYLEPGCWSLNFLNENLWWQGTILATEAIAGISLMAGCYSSLSCVVAWIAWTSILRRTEPATNAGDFWMACLLFWGIFLPLGNTFSVDKQIRKGGKRCATCSLAPAVFVAQVLVVYLYAGISKLNGDWLNGSALGYILSVHDHGTWVGEILGSSKMTTYLLTVATLCLEIIGPLLFLFCGNRSIRRSIAILFIFFHIGIWINLSVGIFAPIGISAWLALMPWGSGSSPSCSADFYQHRSNARLGQYISPIKDIAVAISFCIAGLSLFYNVTTKPRTRSYWASVAINAITLEQSWGMFGDAGPQEQWITGKATLQDDSVVDLLREGRPFCNVRPQGGFSSLPNHRWHKIFWELPKARQAPLREAVAAGIVTDWNRRKPTSKAVRTLEIYYTQVIHEGKGAAHDFPKLTQGGVPQEFSPNSILRQWLLTTWPPREAGAGNLDRFLEETEEQSQKKNLN